MGDDQNRTASMCESTRVKIVGGTCAIAGVRGDVTTMRAAEAVRARAKGVAQPRQTEIHVDTGSVFPIRLLDLGQG